MFRSLCLLQRRCNSKFFAEYPRWQTLSHNQRINDALATMGPLESPILAYYQGLGFEKIGGGYLSCALHSFERAIELSKQFPNEMTIKEWDDCFKKSVRLQKMFGVCLKK